MFDEDSNNYGQNKCDILKAFVRTQLYRPLFFKHNNYEKFTSNEDAYWCKTEKIYVDHDGNSNVLYTTDNSINVPSSDEYQI